MTKKRDEDEVAKAQAALDRASYRDLKKRKDLAKRLAIDCRNIGGFLLSVGRKNRLK